MRHLNLEIKGVTDEGTFTGLLSPYGPPADSTGDIVERGAYLKTLQEQGVKRPLLWQHDVADPIGELTLEDRADGLYCRGQLLLQLPSAQRAYILAKAGICKGLSIGFLSLKDSVQNGIRFLKEIRLFEGSIVTFAAAESAMITSVKSELGKFPAAASELRREARRHMKTADQILGLLDEDANSMHRCAQLIDEMKGLLRVR